MAALYSHIQDSLKLYSCSLKHLFFPIFKLSILKPILKQNQAEPKKKKHEGYVKAFKIKQADACKRASQSRGKNEPFMKPHVAVHIRHCLCFGYSSSSFPENIQIIIKTKNTLRITMPVIVAVSNSMFKRLPA